MSVDKMQFCFLPERGTIDAIFILRRVSCKRKMLDTCFVNLENAFDLVPRKVSEWALRKKGITDVLARSEMSLHDGTKMRVRVDSEMLEEFEVKVVMHQGYTNSVSQHYQH